MTCRVLSRRSKIMDPPENGGQDDAAPASRHMVMSAMNEANAVSEDLRSRGLLLGAESLASQDKAVRVTVPGRVPEIIDGGAARHQPDGGGRPIGCGGLAPHLHAGGHHPVFVAAAAPRRHHGTALDDHPVARRRVVERGLPVWPFIAGAVVLVGAGVWWSRRRRP